MIFKGQQGFKVINNLVQEDTTQPTTKQPSLLDNLRNTNRSFMTYD